MMRPGQLNGAVIPAGGNAKGLGVVSRVVAPAELFSAREHILFYIWVMGPN